MTDQAGPTPPTEPSAPVSGERIEKLEGQLRKSFKLACVGELTGGVIHEFNNMLVGVLGNAELALMDLPAGSELRPMMEDIERSARRAVDLIRRMLTFTGRVSSCVQPIGVNRLIRAMEGLLKVAAHRKVDLRYDLDPSPPLVEADPLRIQDAVMHLVMNAVDAADGDGGLVTLGTGQLTLTGETAPGELLAGSPAPGEHVVIQVADNGPGLPPGAGMRVFEPFFSGHPDGRGLGLAEALTIAREHGGGLRVAPPPATPSTTRRGTTIQILLPRM